ncbi:MAG: helix-turn-helix transcriptional regulator [Clostridia bacterium]|nr:helix-turn-helix transcriptional regulator [Clostridia bacterium]
MQTSLHDEHTGTLALAYDPFVLTTGRFAPGQADRYCAAQTGADRCSLGLAELMYYRGDVQRASKEFVRLTASEDSATVMASILCRSICALSGGDIHDILDSYDSAKALSAALSADEPMRKMSDFFLLYFNILINNVPDIHFPAVGVNAFSVPQSLKPMAFYAYAHYLIETGDIGRAVGMAEGALIFMEKPCPVAEIYLCLMVSIGYTVRCIWDKAEYYFRHAWELAKPDGLIMPFAEHRGMLSGMLEKCLRYEEPQAYKKILELANKYHKRWVFVHNALTGDRIADSLTAIEYNVASLAAKEMTNKEIADFLGITVNSVRAHLRNIFNKLCIESRKEIGGYVI